VGPNIDGTLDKMESIAPNNVKFLRGIYGNELVEICSNCKVYIQASFHESFGCSLAEAMLCECIPVVSKNAALPEVAGNAGIYLDELTPKELANKIEYALSLPDMYGKNARKQILSKFGLLNRRNRIISVIEGMGD
jgi:glycosyltransferase involved in cell wall biosynthesis